MSLEQCNHCLYRDAIMMVDGARFCPVREARPDASDCSDFEPEDDRWGPAGDVGEDAEG